MESHISSVNVHNLHRQIYHAKSALSSLDNELKREMYEEGYLIENANELALLLHKLVNALDTILELRYFPEFKKLAEGNPQLDTKDGEELRRIGRRVKDVIRVTSEITPQLKFVNGARATANPWGMVSQLDRLCRSICPDARVIIRPRWQHNYSYFPITNTLWVISQSATKQASRINISLAQILVQSPYFFSLAFPPTTKPNLLQMAIWGHEIGHFIDNYEAVIDPGFQEGGDQKIGYYSRKRVGELKPESAQGIVESIIQAEELSANSEEDKITAAEFSDYFARLMGNWAKEIFADIISVRLFGPAAIFALVDFAEPLEAGLDVSENPAYPPLRIRLNILLRTFREWLRADPEMENFLSSTSDQYMQKFMLEIKRLEKIASPVTEGGDFDGDFRLISQFENAVFADVKNHVMNNVGKVTSAFDEDIARIVSRSPECYFLPGDLKLIPGAVDDLVRGVPPIVYPDSEMEFSGIHKRILAIIANAGWIYWLIRRENVSQQDPALTDFNKLQREFENVNALLMKAVEGNEALKWYAERKSFGAIDDIDLSSEIHGHIQKDIGTENEQVAVFGAPTISLIPNHIRKDGLEIRPILNMDSQNGNGFIELRLGNEFKVLKRSVLTELDPAEIHRRIVPTQRYSKTILPFGKPFVLHPMQFVLTSTIEFVIIPSDCVGLISGRNSWTRLGLLQLATSGELAPGYRGQVELEITNLGSTPILIYPGSRICKLTLVAKNQTIY